MTSIAHIINPTAVDKKSDLIIAQPITFKTMRIAREFAADKVDVNLYAVQFQEKTPLSQGESFIRLPDLTRSVSDIETFNIKRKLPLMKDILDALYRNSSGDYMIYTNVDIALQPYFYIAALKIIEQGCDAFIINRRTIPGHYKHTHEIPLMYAEPGEKHKGWDCFIFKREFYPDFDLGNACIGTGWIGRVMITNMATFAKNFKIFEELHLTFHIGNEKAWKADEYDDYIEHNKNECRRILIDFDKKYGPFDRKGLPGRFLTKFENNDQRQYKIFG